MPRPAAGAQVPPQPLLELGREALDPAVHGRVVDLDAAVDEHALEVAVADRELQVPPHRPEDDLGREAEAAEEPGVGHERCSEGGGGSAAPTRSRHLAQCNRSVEVIFADGAYQGDGTAASVAGTGRWRLEIVRRSDSAGFVPLPKRWIVERTFAWLGRRCRLAKDFENLAVNALAFLCLGMIRAHAAQAGKNPQAANERQMSASSSAFASLEVGSVETLGEPAADRGE